MVDIVVAVDVDVEFGVNVEVGTEPDETLVIEVPKIYYLLLLVYCICKINNHKQLFTLRLSNGSKNNSHS